MMFNFTGYNNGNKIFWKHLKFRLPKAPDFFSFLRTFFSGNTVDNDHGQDTSRPCKNLSKNNFFLKIRYNLM